MAPLKKQERIAVYEAAHGHCYVCDLELKHFEDWHVIDKLLLCSFCNELKKGRTWEELRIYLTLELTNAEELLERFGSLGQENGAGLVFAGERGRMVPGITTAEAMALIKAIEGEGPILHGVEAAAALLMGGRAVHIDTDQVARDVGLEHGDEVPAEEAHG